MPEFDDLFGDLAPKGTREFTLDRVFVHCDKPIVLIVRHAGDGNAEYKSARAKIIRELDAHSQRGDSDAVQGVMRKIYAQTVVAGWKNCLNKDGEPIPHSPALAAELFEQIAKNGGNDELGPMFAFAANADNFRDSPVAQAAHLGK